MIKITNLISNLFEKFDFPIMLHFKHKRIKCSVYIVKKILVRNLGII